MARFVGKFDDPFDEWFAAVLVFAVAFGAVATSAVISAPASPAAQTSCTADAGYAVCVAFTNTGADQSFTLPAAADSSNVLVKAWGAGGGASNIPAVGGYSSGGAGGYASGVISTTPAAAFTVVVGTGGAYDGQTPGNAYGFGGSSTLSLGGSGGGGLAGLFVGGASVAATDTARAVVVAGGGGSGDTNACGNCFSLGGQGGGAFSGGQPTMQGQDSTFSSGQGDGGGAGGGYSGGVADSTRLTVPGIGIRMGEGGSNYTGGAAGATVTDGVSSASAEYTTANIASNDGRLPPHVAEAQYQTPVGVGSTLINGQAAAMGGNGLVVLEYNLRPTVTIAKVSNGATGTFDFTGTNGVAPTTTQITTITAGVPVSSPTYRLSSNGTVTTITEAPAAHFTLDSTSTCTGMGSGGTASLDTTTGVLTLDAAAVVDNAAIVCTFSNSVQSASLDATKVLTSVNGNAATAGQSVQGGDILVYTITVTNSGGTPATTVLGETVPANTAYTGSGEGWTLSGASATRSVTVAASSTSAATFTVTVASPLTDAATITNTVTSTVGTCSACVVSDPGPVALANTGVDSKVSVILASLLVGLGALFELAGRRRATRG